MVLIALSDSDSLEKSGMVGVLYWIRHCDARFGQLSDFYEQEQARNLSTWHYLGGTFGGICVD